VRCGPLRNGTRGISCNELLGVPVCRRLEHKRTPFVYRNHGNFEYLISASTRTGHQRRLSQRRRAWICSVTNKVLHIYSQDFLRERIWIRARTQSAPAAILMTVRAVPPTIV
jgi:hypothetical protein